MTFEEKYAGTYRWAFEFHKRHSGAKTEDDFEKMAEDDENEWNGTDFAVALYWAVVDEIRRELGKEGETP